MLAEDLGHAISDQPQHEESVLKARYLIQQALEVDPIFAAELSCVCGEKVWQQVGIFISGRLRSWRDEADEHHRQCALAGMIATGAPDFSDVILPLLTSGDQQTRLRAYRAWPEFHVSSLGADWRRLVAAWNEDCRIDFVGEIARKRENAHIAEELALTDLSRKVRGAAVQVLFFVDAVERLRRVLDAADDTTFAELLRAGMLIQLPVDLRARALSASRTLLESTEDPWARLEILVVLHELGQEEVTEEIKHELSHIAFAGARREYQWFLVSVLKLVRNTAPEWVNGWLVDRIIDGSFWGSHWVTFISSFSDSQRQRLLDEIGGRELNPIEMHRLEDLIAVADGDLCGRLFSRACEIRSGLSSALNGERSRLSAILRQLEDSLRRASPGVAVASIVGSLSGDLITHEYSVVIDIFGSVGNGDFDLRTELGEDVRGRLRGYLSAGIRYVLNQDDDYSGI